MFTTLKRSYFKFIYRIFANAIIKFNKLSINTNMALISDVSYSRYNNS